MAFSATWPRDKTYQVSIISATMTQCWARGHTLRFLHHSHGKATASELRILRLLARNGARSGQARGA
jgi:hypothetical protein